MSNTYTKDLSDSIFFLNDKNIILDLNVSGVINPIASHLLVKNISDDVDSYILTNDLNISALSTSVSELFNTDIEIKEKIESISANVAVAYKPMGSVSAYSELEAKLNEYTALSSTTPASSHIGEVWNVTGSDPNNPKETGKNYVFILDLNSTSGFKWDDIGGIVDLSEYALISEVETSVGQLETHIDTISTNISSRISSETKLLSDYIDNLITSVSNTILGTVNSSYVHISGDTITGNLNAKNISVETDINASNLKASSTLEVGSTVKIEDAKVLLGHSKALSNGLFVWNGIVSNDYDAKGGYGTFSINPFGSTEGIYIGDTSLCTILSNVIQASSIGVSDALTTKVSTVSSDLTGIINTVSTDLTSKIYGVNNELTSLSGEVYSLNNTLTGTIKDISDELNGSITTNTTLITNLSSTSSNRIDEVKNDLDEKIIKTNGTLSEISTNLIAVNGNLKNDIDALSTVHIEQINNDIANINNSITSLEYNVSTISNDVGELKVTTKEALALVLKTVEFVGHIQFSNPEDAKKTATSISAIISSFNLPETKRIKNGSMYHIEFDSAETANDADEKAKQYVDVPIKTKDGSDATIRLSHGDYIIFHDHEVNEFIDINNITLENVYVTEVSYSDLYSLSTAVSVNYAYLSGNTGEHALQGTHDYVGSATINVSAGTINVSSNNISIANISTETVENATITSAAITSATVTDLTGSNAYINSLSASVLTATDVSSTNITATNTNILNLTATNLTATSANILNLISEEASINKISATESLSGKFIITPSSNISTAIISTANISTATINTATIDTASISTATIDTANISTATINTANISTDNINTATIDTANISTATINTANISTSISAKFDSVYDKTLSLSLAKEISTLSTTIDNKIYIWDKTNTQLTSAISSNLSVVKLSNKDYTEIINNTSNASDISNTLYVIDDDYIDAYGQVISNATNTSAVYYNGLNGYISESQDLETISKSQSNKESEVATVEYVNTIVQTRITNSYNKIYNALSVL